MDVGFFLPSLGRDSCQIVPRLLVDLAEAGVLAEAMKMFQLSVTLRQGETAVLAETV